MYVLHYNSILWIILICYKIPVGHKYWVIFVQTFYSYGIGSTSGNDYPLEVMINQTGSDRTIPQTGVGHLYHSRIILYVTTTIIIE